MKHILRLTLTALLCLALAGCGKTADKDHEYILHLLENGDYDMAISVIENLRDRELGTPRPVETAATETPATEATVPETTTPPFDSQVQLVMDTVSRYLEEDGNARMEAFEKITASPAGTPEVLHAMEYRLGNIMGSGKNAHFLFIGLRMNVAVEGGCDDSVRLLLDLEDQTLLSSAQLDWRLIENCGGMPTTMAEFYAVALNTYSNYFTFGDRFIMTDSEIWEDLSESDIAAINEALK